MTCREKLKLEHPDCVSPEFMGGCSCCPCTYGYLDDPNYCEGYGDWDQCTECWDREIPEEQEHDVCTPREEQVFAVDEDGFEIEENNNEKEKNMATKKTKAELEKELETIKESKAELEKELKNLEKYKQYEDAAGEIHGLYTSFMMAGFSEDQAFELTKTILENADYTPARKPIYRSYR